MKTIFLFIMVFLGAQPAYADDVIEAVPSNWRLQNYLNESKVVTWFTGSPCSNGQLLFSPNTSEETLNRYWSLVLTAKAASKIIGVYYDPMNCQITSFYAK